MRTFLFRHNASDGANALADALNIKKIALRNSKYVHQPEDIIINWGASKFPDEVNKGIIINEPKAVATAVNKLECFRAISGVVNVPDYTDNKWRAQNWLEAGHMVFVRHKLNGAGGEGIEIFDDVYAKLPDAPLYTIYRKKKSEWRVHVMCGDIIHVARKVRDPNFPEDKVNWRVRNKANGFIFQIHNDVVPDKVVNAACRSVEALGLHFGAVDVIYNESLDRAYVLEVNTAPGIEGTTLEKYVFAFNKLLRTF